MGDFLWTPDAVRWMRDAAAKSGYYQRLAGRILPYLPPQARLLDAGCGTGELARALAPHAACVTAMDVSAPALDALRDCPDNVRPLLADAFRHEPEEPYDALLLCYFARPGEFLKLSRLSRGPVCLVCDRKRRDDYARRLEAADLSWREERFRLRFDQPLRTREEALRYAAHYALPPGSIRRSGDAEFGYAIRKTRDIALMCYEAGGGA
ncbi:MAG: methyltransferase domain-containing protein [Clostridia bacterium]|nr:methyltransferase domain-containing protein [Clostridia bacterium]